MAFLIGGTAGAIIGGGVLGLGSAAINSGAAGSAADKQLIAAREANALQEKEYDQTRADQEPWRQAGSQALSKMSDPNFQHQFGMSDFQNSDPGYNFRMQQGQQALDRSAAARGGLNSGAQMKALTQYGQDYASNEYQNAYNRFEGDQTNRFNRLSSIAGMGQTANASNAAAGSNYASQVGNNMTGAANAAGAAGIAQANAFGGALSSIGNNAMTANWMDKWNAGRK